MDFITPKFTAETKKKNNRKGIIKRDIYKRGSDGITFGQEYDPDQFSIDNIYHI